MVTTSVKKKTLRGTCLLLKTELKNKNLGNLLNLQLVLKHKSAHSLTQFQGEWLELEFPDSSSPFRVTQYCFHLRRVTSSSFLSLCRVTRGLKESQPARLTTPCSFSNRRSSCSSEPSAESLLLSPSSVPVDTSILSPPPAPPCPVPVSSSRMKFS